MSMKMRQARARLAAAAAETKAAAAAKPVELEQNSAPKLKMLAQSLEKDLKRLSDLPQGTARIEPKKKLLAEYSEQLEDYLASSDTYEFPLLTQAMIWAFDVEDLELALRLAKAAIEENQKMPERFSSDVQTFVGDTLHDIAKAKMGDKGELIQEFTDYTETLLAAKTHDAVKAKWCKLLADAAAKAEDWPTVKTYGEKAKEFDPKAKVTQILGRAEKALKKSEGQQSESQ